MIVKHPCCFSTDVPDSYSDAFMKRMTTHKNTLYILSIVTPYQLADASSGVHCLLCGLQAQPIM